MRYPTLQIRKQRGRDRKCQVGGRARTKPRLPAPMLWAHSTPSDHNKGLERASPSATVSSKHLFRKVLSLFRLPHGSGAAGQHGLLSGGCGEGQPPSDWALPPSQCPSPQLPQVQTTHQAWPPHLRCIPSSQNQAQPHLVCQPPTTASTRIPGPSRHYLTLIFAPNDMLSYKNPPKALLDPTALWSHFL